MNTCLPPSYEDPSQFYPSLRRWLRSVLCPLNLQSFSRLGPYSPSLGSSFQGLEAPSGQIFFALVFLASAVDSGTKLSANACRGLLKAVLEGSRSQLPSRFSMFQREGSCDTQPSVRNELQVQASFVVVLGLSGVNQEVKLTSCRQETYLQV